MHALRPPSFPETGKTITLLLTLLGLVLPGVPTTVTADEGLCVNWLQAFGLRQDTYHVHPRPSFPSRPPPSRPFETVESTIRGRIKTLVVGEPDSVFGTPTRWSVQHPTMPYRYNRYGTEIRAQAYVELLEHPGQLFGLRLLGEGRCGLSEVARLDALRDARNTNSFVTLKYLTIAPFEYAWDADEDGYVVVPHTWRNGFILEVTVGPRARPPRP